MDVPQPYRILQHPGSTWLDCLIDWILSIILPLLRMVSDKPASRKEKSLAKIQAVRDKGANLDNPSIRGLVRKWSKLANAPIVEYVGTLPVEKDILKSWRIVEQEEELKQPINNAVKVMVWFPSSILPCELNTGRKTDNGCIKVETLDLSSFALDVTLIVHFHGGGFVMGTERDSMLLRNFVDLSKTAEKFNGPQESLKPFILVSVDYSLAPERAFPCGVVDGLSVIEYFLSSNPSRKIHISGISAGGNLALVTALETHRRYPGRVISVLSQAPMLCPAADSLSYYMNATSSKFLPVHWLRWCWKVYLGMEEAASKSPNPTKPRTIEQVVQHGSNRCFWDACKWSGGPTRRLAEPMADIPYDWRLASTKFLIVVNKADPLHDDGIAMVKALEGAGANVALFEHSGIHVFGSEIDRNGKQKFLESWSNAIFH